MNKIIISLLTVIILTFGAAAVATDLDAEAAKRGGTNFSPWTVDGDGFKRIWDAGYSCLNLSKIQDNDDDWWNHPNGVHKNWPYMIFKFDRPGGFSSGTCYWEVRQAGGSNVLMYRWKPSSDEFIYVHQNTGGSSPSVMNYYVGGGVNYWSDDDKFHCMATASASSPTWGIECDLCKITY